MQILVTDATGAVGRFVTRQLIAAGHTVSGIAERPSPYLDPAVETVYAPLHDPVLRELADEADAVIHLAPLEGPAPGAAGVSGLARVADAAARAGARLIFVSQAAGHPDLYGPAEDLVTSGWAPSLVVRVAPPVGRQLDWMVCRSVATILRAKVSARPMRVLHLDDLVRFLALALTVDRTGVVDLATPDTTNVVTAWRLLRAVDPRLRLHRVPGWTELIPTMNSTAAQEDWGFEYGWQALDALVDTGRGLLGRKLEATGAITSSGRPALPVEGMARFGPPDDETLGSAVPDATASEFDDRIDPRLPAFSATALLQALPAPLTPMTSDVQLTGLWLATQAVGRVLARGEAVADDWANRAVAMLGHPVGGSALSDDAPGSPAKSRVTAGSVALTRHLRTDTKTYAAAAAAEHLDAAALADLPVADLEVRIRLLRDRIHQGWVLAGLWLIETGAGGTAVGEIGQDDRVATEIASLAAILRDDEPLRALARVGNLDSVRALSPQTATALEVALAGIGHRGPGDGELANPVYGDDPVPLLAAAARLAEEPPVPAAGSRPKRRAASARLTRALAHDSAYRFTHELRMTLRELGSRRVTADLMDTVDDLYYLTCDELVTVAPDARLRIKRRRAERERIQAHRPPAGVEDAVDRALVADG